MLRPIPPDQNAALRCAERNFNWALLTLVLCLIFTSQAQKRASEAGLQLTQTNVVLSQKLMEVLRALDACNAVYVDAPSEHTPSEDEAEEGGRHG